MESLKLRPRFKFESPKGPAEIMDNLINKLRMPSEYIVGSTLMKHAYLKIIDKKQHYWSPELHITVEQTETGSSIRGVAGPKPKIWTMFMFFYLAIIVLFLFGSALGVAQWSLGIDAPWLWSIPASILAWFIILAAAKYGQHKGKKQLKMLYEFANEALK